MPRLCQGAPSLQAGIAHWGWPPSGRLTHLRTKVSEAHLRIPRDQTHFSHKRRPRLPFWGLLFNGKPSWNGPDQDPLQSQKALIKTLLSQVTWLDLEEVFGTVTYYMLLHEIELNPFKII